MNTVKTRTREKIVVIVVTIAAITSAPRSSRAELAELLQQVHLKPYFRSTIPPEFIGHTVDDQPITSGSLKGKVVFLNFWASWCLECRPEMPVFEKLHREFSSQGLAVIGINAREAPATIRDYAKELGLTFRLVLDSSGQINSTYGVVGLPTTFLIGRDGRAVGLAVGPRDWSGNSSRELIRTLLAATRTEK
ncbi:MAG TPA: TlpA disulfide reductase family protein [Candidatus Binatia bacterium]